ncbi:hypothetical protein ACIRBX_26020 [Kitasatospora sp. NPDC096147]|uniref:pilus assembly PilX family protein n=1 Tax=Kitasatospora sp. NPDC096147 TaxID=3364093 RepID=UPI0038073F50
MTARPSPPGRPHRDEQGATLILALAFVLVLSLIAVSVLSFAGTSLRAASGFAEQGRRAYGADGATQLAISRFAQGAPCTDYTAPPLNGHQLTVHCDPLDASPATARVTQPQDALLALGRAADEGIRVTTPGLRVQGGVFSHADVTTGPGASAVVAGDVSALGSCSPAVTRIPLPPTQAPYVRSCAGDTPSAPADPVVGADPDLAPPTTAVPVRRTVPACPGAGGGWLVRLQPGSYDDADALTRLTGGSCPGIVVWLPPGLYYFDLGFTGGGGTWTVADPTVAVVGGTPSGWDPGAAARPTVPDPGGCDRTAPEGVELVMGGTGRVQVDRGRVELCAPVRPGAQQVAVYGVRPPQASHALKPTLVAGDDGFADPARALTAGERPTLPGCPPPAAPEGATGCTADAVLGLTGRRAAELRLGAFSPKIPPGSVVTAATLHVRHQEDGDLTAPGGLTVTAAVDGAGCRTDPLPPHPALITDTPIDLLSACGLTDPARFAGLSVAYRAALDAEGTAATARLDGLWLEVAYRTPVTSKPTEVTGTTGFHGGETASGTGGALEIGEQPTPSVVRADLGPAARTGAITLAGFGRPPLPPGSRLDSAVLRVAHQESGDAAGAAITVTPAGGGARCTGLPVPRRTDLAEDRLDLTACGITDPAQLTGLTATYSAGLTPGGREGAAVLDGIWLEVVHTPPPPRPATSAESTDFLPPAAALAIDGTATARAALGPAAPTATIALGGFDTAAVAPGSVLDGAVLHVAHREDPGAPGGPPPTVTLTPSGPGTPRPCTPQALPVRQGALGTDTVDLVAACGLTDPSQLAGLRVTHTAALAAGGGTATAHLDGVALELTWRPPIPVRPSTAAGAASSGSAAFGDPGLARAIDGAASTSTLAPAAPSASLRLGGFAVPRLPAGSVTDRVLLRVSHQEDDTTPPPAEAPVPAPPVPPAPPAPAAPPTAVLTVSGTGTACDTRHALTARQGTLGTDVIDLRACGVTRDDQLAGLTAEYTAGLAPGSSAATSRLDGVQLDLVVRAPAVRPLSGCLTTGTACPLLRSTADADTATAHSRLVVNGTVHAPTAAIDLAMRQVTGQVVTRGIVARAITLGIAPAPGYLRPVVGIPPEPVRFTTYPTVTAAPASASAADGFTTPAPGAPADVTEATLPGGGRATLTLGGYDRPAPATATAGPLEHAVLQVTHREDGDAASVRVAVDFPGSSCTGPDGAPALPVRTGADGPVTDRIDLAGCGLTDAAQLAGLTVTPTVTAGPGGATAHLGGARILLLSGPLLQAAVSFDGHSATVGQWKVLT